MSDMVPLDSFCEDRPLADSIVLATRPVHAKLNKLIIARLPLALPPRATSPLAYAIGLMHIAPIYTTFESAWLDVLGNPDASRVTPDLQESLELLHLSGLLRRDQLEADIQSMRGWSQAETRAQLDIVSKTGHLAEFIRHIRRTIKNKPHVLLAYSYILFMALFAGGRFIRATLESAGPGFWQGTLSDADSSASSIPPQTPDGMPLRFFHFDTPLDGEDLRREFKQRLAHAEKLLSYREKHDIVQEAICIFENMVLVIAQLDNVAVAGDASHASGPSRRNLGESIPTAYSNPSVYRFRDSVAVTKERSARVHSSRETNKSPGSSEICIAGNMDTPAVSVGTHSTMPNNHPIIPSAIGIALCPAASKSIRFDESLPQPTRRHLGAGDSTVDLTESLKMASKRLRREQVTNWVFGVTVGFIILAVVLSGRWAASSE